MKKLEEVIESLSVCSDFNRTCYECSYTSVVNCEKHLEKDALHYLKEYKELKDECGL